MKKLVVISMALIAFATTNALAYDAHGSAFGSFAIAKASGQGKGALGSGVGIADNATSVIGWFNYGLSEYVDGRVKIGILDPDNGDSKVTLGADIRYQFWDIGDIIKRPFDMAFGGFFEYVDYDFRSVWQLGGQAIGSYPFEQKNGTTITPYGRFNIRLEGYSPEIGDSDTEIKFGINGGVAWKITQTINIYGEFQIDGNDGIFLGIDFGVL